MGEDTSVVLGHRVRGALLQQPQETNTNRLSDLVLTSTVIKEVVILPFLEIKKLRLKKLSNLPRSLEL